MCQIFDDLWLSDLPDSITVFVADRCACQKWHRSCHVLLLFTHTSYSPPQAIMHYGESIKAIGNEVRRSITCCAGCKEMFQQGQITRSNMLSALQEFGDGIMSAIDMFGTIDTVTGKLGEKRMVITLNGKVACKGHGLTYCYSLS